ncbi:hypothetical protein RFI_23705 [Reticulomyxa filosa]|uniref:Uncharacterized protein n=1 Tax=Reticulomyxa filosa TaxID=46433 RepID=X6MJN9_RETFI|nr:hypothetical protein RFI_23705 [Reticulomyxa filosa]|eukprot:ETO13662.1 hypothetical protein RFI_23705 [Reticulomyxa filosa]
MSEQEYLSQLVNHLVTPLEVFRKEIEVVSALKWKYTDLKTEYDFAVNNLNKANKSETTPEKLQELQQKKTNKENELNQLRKELLEAVQQMENKKNTEILSSVQRYYGALLGYSKQVANIMQKNPIQLIDVGTNSTVISNVTPQDDSKENEALSQPVYSYDTSGNVPQQYATQQYDTQQYDTQQYNTQQYDIQQPQTE